MSSGYGRKVLVFGVDIGSSVYVDNKKIFWFLVKVQCKDHTIPY